MRERKWINMHCIDICRPLSHEINTVKQYITKYKNENLRDESSCIMHGNVFLDSFTS